MSKAVKVKEAPPPSALTDIFSEFKDDVAISGKVGRDDLALPFVKILQGLSAELKRDKPTFIKGAAIGDIVLTVLNKHWTGDAGVDVIFCHYSRAFIEWRPLDAGGGIVNIYPPEDRIVTSTPRGEKGAMVLPNGNSLVETAYHAVLIDVDGKWVQAVLPLKGTMLKISKRLNNVIVNFEVEDKNGQSVSAPRWMQIFKMTTGTASGGGNDWAVPIFTQVYVLDVNNLEKDREIYLLGRKWAIAANKGTSFATAEAAQTPKGETLENEASF